LLISGALAPGEKLSLRAVADALGVSIMPIRGAVSRLVANHALEVAPNRAVRVPIMSAERFQDLARVRLQIEGFAAEQAALLRTPDDLAAITSAEACLRTACLAAQPNRPQVIELNKAFHFVVYQAAQSATLLEIIRALWLKVGPVLNLGPERLRTQTVACHTKLLKAIKAKDALLARMALQSDVEGAAKFILAQGRLPSNSSQETLRN
jgi:DNA-binding GntR family transcriptional regulator